MIGSTFGLRLLTKPSVQLSVLMLLAVLVVVFRISQFAYLTTQPQWGYDLSFYWTAARHLLDGEPIYSVAQLAGPYAPQGQDGFLYPPAFAAIAVPLAVLVPQGAGVAEWIWSSLGAVVLVAVVLAVAQSEHLAERYPLLRGKGLWLLVVAALTFPPVIGELSIGNVHMLLLGLFTLGWLGIRRGHRTGDWLAGLSLGVAALIKVFPAVLLVWLLATRRYRVAVAMVVSGVLVALTTVPITGLEPWRQYPTVLANLAAVVDTTDTISPTVWLAPALGFTVARIVVTVAGLGLLIASARTGAASRPQNTSSREADPTAASYAIAVMVSVLIAPNVFHHYLAILVLPMLLAMGAGVRLRWIVLAYLLMSGGRQDALGDAAWIVNRALPTLGAFVLLCALVPRLARRGRAAGDDQRSVTAQTMV